MNNILKIKKLLNSLLWKVRKILPEALKPILFKPPDELMQTEEYCKKRDLPFRKLRDKEIVERRLPESPEPEIHWRFKKKIFYSYPETWLAELPESYIIGRFGHILTSEWILLTDASYHLGSQNPSKHPLLKQHVTIPKKQRLEGLSTVLTGPSSRGYFHWLTDSLPRLQLVEQAGYSIQDIDHIIIPPGNLPAVAQSLDMLGIKTSHRIVATKRASIHAERLILPSMPGKSGNPSPEARHYLREKFLNNENASQNPFPKRIYISRKKTRRIRNEAELLPILQKHGIETVVPENLSFSDQISLFAGAKLVIAPHGAALTNLLFCSPGTFVLEFFSPNYVNTCYWSISNIGNLRYSYILGEGKRPPEYLDPHNVREDITLAIEKVERWIQKWDKNV